MPSKYKLKFSLPEKSLFAVLLRSPWWISALIAVSAIVLARFVPDHLVLALTLVSVPFAVVSVMSAWRNRHKPSASQIERTVEAVSAMSWREFSDALEQAYRRDGYAVTRMNGAADFLLEKDGRSILVACKRWKAASHGIEPLRELVNARREKEAREACYVFVAEMTDKARDFASDYKVTLLRGAELAQLLRLR